MSWYLHFSRFISSSWPHCFVCLNATFPVSLALHPCICPTHIPLFFWLENRMSADCPHQSLCCQGYWGPLHWSFMFILVFGWLPLPATPQSKTILPHPPAQTLYPPILVLGFSTLLHGENRSYWAWTPSWHFFICFASHPLPHVNRSPPSFSEEWSPSSLLLFEAGPAAGAWTSASQPSLLPDHCLSLLYLLCHSPQTRSVSSAKKCILVFPIPTKLGSGNK